MKIARYLIAIMVMIIGSNVVYASPIDKPEELIVVLQDSDDMSVFEKNDIIKKLEEKYDMLFVGDRRSKYLLFDVPNAVINDLVVSVSSDPLVSTAGTNNYDSRLNSEPLFYEQWYLSNSGQGAFVGYGYLENTSTGSSTIISEYPTGTGSDIKWLDIQTDPRCNGAICSGANVDVAVIDSGVEFTHPDLVGSKSPLSISYDGGAVEYDTVGHGTFVSSLIASRINGTGIVGVAPNSTIIGIKLTSDAKGGSISENDILNSLSYAASSGADVINFSIGTGYSSLMKSLMLEIANDYPKTIIVASSGNNATLNNPIVYPAAFPETISVSGVDSFGEHSFFSTYNDMVDISAPATALTGARSYYKSAACNIVNITLEWRINYYGTETCFFDDDYQVGSSGEYYLNSGTSFSAPLVSGAAALMKEKYGNKLNTDKFREALKYSSDHPTLPSGQRDDYYGYGRLNLERLLSYNFAPEILPQQVAFNPASAPNGGTSQVQLIAQIENMEGFSDVTSVVADFASIGLGSVTLNHNGNLNYSTTIIVQSSTTAGNYSIPVTVTDLGGKSATASASLAVIDSSSGGTGWIDPGTTIPAVGEPTGSDISIEITSPNKGKDDITRKDKVTIKGEAGSGVAYVDVNGEAATLDVTSGDWSLKIELDEGDNDIETIAYDVTRTNTATDDMTIELDTEAPKDVKDLKYSNGKLSWDESKSNDVEGYHVYQMNGKKKKEIDVTTKTYAEVSGSGPFRVTAEDEAGNESDIDDAPEIGGVMESADTGFSDVPKTHWASGYVYALRQGKVIEGQGGRFDPDRLVTRAEFAKMLLGARKQQVGAETTMFVDVPQGYSLSKYIQAVLTQGWARGQGRNFYPGRPITRMEAAWMIVRAARLKETKPADFPDIKDLNEKIVAGMLVENGIASGNNGKFLPDAFLTRAEAAKMLAGVMI